MLSTIFLTTSRVLRDPIRPPGLYPGQGGGRVIACDSQNGHNFMGKKLQIPQFYALSICDGLNGPWKQLTGASTTIHVEVSVQILDNTRNTAPVYMDSVWPKLSTPQPITLQWPANYKHEYFISNIFVVGYFNGLSKAI